MEAGAVGPVVCSDGLIVRHSAGIDGLPYHIGTMSTLQATCRVEEAIRQKDLEQTGAMATNKAIILLTS